MFKSYKSTLRKMLKPFSTSSVLLCRGELHYRYDYITTFLNNILICLYALVLNIICFLLTFQVGITVFNLHTTCLLISSQHLDYWSYASLVHCWWTEGTMVAFLSLHTSGILGVKLCLDSFHWLGVHCGFCPCFPHSSGTSQCTSSPSRIFLAVKHQTICQHSVSSPQVSILPLYLDRLPHGPDGCSAVTPNHPFTSALAWVSYTPDPTRASPLIEPLILVSVIFENCTMFSFFPSFLSFLSPPPFLFFSFSSCLRTIWQRAREGLPDNLSLLAFVSSASYKGPWMWSLVLRFTCQKAEALSPSPLFLPICFSLALDC